MSNKIILLAALFIFPIDSFGAEDQITLSTFYPSPVGSYQELRAVRIAIGDNYSNTSNYNWQGASGNRITGEADLIVEGRLGIGTWSPQAPLTIATGNGNNKVEGLSLVNTLTDIVSSPSIHFFQNYADGITNRYSAFIYYQPLSYDFYMGRADSMIPGGYDATYGSNHWETILPGKLNITSSANYQSPGVALSVDGNLSMRKLGRDEIPSTESFGTLYVKATWPEENLVGDEGIPVFLDSLGNEYNLPRERVVYATADENKKNPAAIGSNEARDSKLKFDIKRGELWQFEFEVYFVELSSRDLQVSIEVPSGSIYHCYVNLESINVPSMWYGPLDYRDFLSNDPATSTQFNTYVQENLSDGKYKAHIISGRVDAREQTAASGTVYLLWTPTAVSPNGITRTTGSYLIARRISWS
jgi:hypothetical protein